MSDFIDRIIAAHRRAHDLDDTAEYPHMIAPMLCFECALVAEVERLRKQLEYRRSETERQREWIERMGRLAPGVPLADYDEMQDERDRYRAAFEKANAAVSARESWIEGAKVDLDGYDEARAAIARLEARVRELEAGDAR